MIVQAFETLGKKKIIVVGRSGEHRILAARDTAIGSFTSLIDWSGIDYVGRDVVPALIEWLNAAYGRPGIRFIHGNLMTCELPQADLAIRTDVPQHWPTGEILTF